MTTHTVVAAESREPSLLPEADRDPFYVTRHPLQALRGRSRGVRPPALPGPVGLPCIGVWHQYLREPHEFMRRAAAQYGDMFRLPFPGWDVVVLNHPSFADQVLCDRDSRYSMVGKFEPWVARAGSSLPGMEGERFRARRRALTAMFSRRNMTRLADGICAEFVTRVDRWQQWAGTGETVDLQHAIAQVTLPAFLRAMYSTSITDDEIAQTDIDIRLMMAGMGIVGFGPLHLSSELLPRPGRSHITGAYVRLRRLVGRLIDDRQANPIDGTDLLQALLEAREADGSPIGHNSMIHELIVLMAGGYDTVVASLSWMLGLLCLNPEPAERLYAEIDTLGGAAPTLADTIAMPWSKACFDEAQRLQGGPLHTRFAMEDVEIAGHRVPKGTLLGVGWYSMHRDPRWWPEPDKFDPTRFTDKDVVAARPKHAFLPFGAGPHHCIGSGMGYLNAQMLMTVILQRYRLAVPEGWQPKHDFMLSSPLKGGLPVTITRVGQ